MKKKGKLKQLCFCGVIVKTRLGINELFSSIFKKHTEKEVKMSLTSSINIDFNDHKSNKDVLIFRYLMWFICF
jgi:hypothetical protein